VQYAQSSLDQSVLVYRLTCLLLLLVPQFVQNAAAALNDVQGEDAHVQADPSAVSVVVPYAASFLGALMDENTIDVDVLAAHDAWMAQAVSAAGEVAQSLDVPWAEAGAVHLDHEDAHASEPPFPSWVPFLAFPSHESLVLAGEEEAAASLVLFLHLACHDHQMAPATSCLLHALCHDRQSDHVH